jgi:hypothetical protein
MQRRQLLEDLDDINGACDAVEQDLTSHGRILTRRPLPCWHVPTVAGEHGPP